MYNAPYSGVANQLAGYGRYGDSMLVHMNPIEVQMLASLSPTGRLTDNPYTGQKEAFLPFLAPLLGSFLGNAALGSTLGATAAGALGSAAATTLATGDLEQGIMSGITGFGIGSALGAAGDAFANTAKDVATQTATQTAADAATTGVTQAITPEALNIQPLSGTPAIPTFTPGSAAANQLSWMEQGLAGSPESLLPMSQQLDVLSQGLRTPVIPPASPVSTAKDLTFGQRLTAPISESGTFLQGLTEPSAFLPMYVGESGRMAREQELMGRGSMKAFEEEQEAQRQKTLGQIGGVYDRIRAAYPGVGYAQGGMIDSYAVGGGVENAIRQAAERMGYGGEYGNFSGSLPYNIPDPESVQLSLRGSEFVPPPAASYSALDVGGEGYLPGVAPEFQYFREPPPPPPTGYVPPPPGTVAGGGGGYPPGGGFGPDDIDLSGIDLSGFRQYRGADFQQPVDSQQPMTTLPGVDFSSLYGGIGAFNQPEMPIMEQAAVMPEEERILAARELQVPVSQFSMPEMDMIDEEMNPFASYREPREMRYGGGMMYAEGGMTEGDMGDQSIVEMTVAAIRGEVENADEIISRFLDMYGLEAFAELRDRVLKDIVPGAQTKGMVEGEGGGQDDMVEGMIGTQRPVAVSPGEYIIPADVVSLAGGGYSGDGAKYFDNLIEDIRMKTMGKTDQIKPYRTGGQS